MAYGKDYADSFRTDPAGWRLKVSEDSHGQHKWVYLPPGAARDAWPQAHVDVYSMGLETGLPDQPKAKTPLEAARNGLNFYRALQSEDGHWATEYGGPLFLTPGLLITLSILQVELSHERKQELIRYLLHKRRPEGGWGLHTASPPTVYGTVMNYVALRLLGLGPDEGPMTEIRALIHEMGGATTIPTWGKVWLSVLGCYDWEGVNPMPPELWLLPDWVPFAPWRWWIHVRAVFTPMTFLWGSRFVGEPTKITAALREELYTQPYASIDWVKQRSNVNEIDLYSPHHSVYEFLNNVLHYYEKVPRLSCLPSIRRAGLRAAYDQVVYEDENTGFQTIGPVSKPLNLLCRLAKESRDSEAVKRHLTRIDDFLWLSQDGLFMTGTNGSQLWDISFLAQAEVETGLANEPENKESVLSMLDWLDKCQMRANPIHWHDGYRHASKGAWPFSTPEQSYTVSDCTAEGLKAVIQLQSLKFTPKPVTLDRMHDSVDILLSMQNPTGGFASYELTRGSAKMEWLNAAEVFGNIMIDYQYPECSTSALSALKYFTTVDPVYRADDIKLCIDRAIEWIHSVQRPDGSWYGSWGICFTYATMFALESLAIAGETCANSERVRRACDFLLSKQKSDGGWGETYLSCAEGVYSQHETSQVVMTSWAILALIYGQSPDKDAIKRGCELIMSRQLPNGSWLQEDTEGIFNKNCAIDYPAFKFIFCIWALGRAEKYLSK
ncbi:Lanosterol synthase [Vanrija pseudolonga]|uniref:Terpene cyclase/mutase family member n=1 Tax=Vanrija pseudolonga TaxID=143232 RepID=A0AAF1BMZ5_9TREE|nr:Lanosterol synthase [Vanrija pseudolonga]